MKLSDNSEKEAKTSDEYMAETSFKLVFPD